MTVTDLAVIGAGPGGLAAAAAAAQAGLQVTLIDERPAPGGQYLSAHPVALPAAGRAHRRAFVSAGERQGQALLGQLARLAIDMRPATLAWDLSPDLRINLFGPQGSSVLQARAVIVAGGGRELALPFPGWTLPGVMTAGAAQLLVKKYGVLPGRRVLVAGSGPLLLPVAHSLAQAGATVVGVLEATRPASWMRHTPAGIFPAGNWDRVREGWHYLNGLRRAHVPIRFGQTVVRALGTDVLETAVVARLDGTGRPIRGSEQTIAVDTLCIGFGLLPNIELTQVAGCDHHYDPAAGGWVPSRRSGSETSVAGLFVAGESAGIGGAAVALTEGRLAALQVAVRLGCADEPRLKSEIQRLSTQQKHLRSFGRLINTVFAPARGLDDLATDETPICRCEEVLAGELRAAVARGARQLDELKTRTRAGQGSCQGRTCGPLAARLLANQAGVDPGHVAHFHVRPPIKPIPLTALAAERDL